jgi:hypothetical protein
MTKITDEEKQKAEWIIEKIAVEITGDILDSLGEVTGQIPDEDVKQRLGAYLVIAALSQNPRDLQVEVSATIMISLLAEVRRWRERYRDPDRPIQ